MTVSYSTLTKSGTEWGEQAAIFLWRNRSVGSLPIVRWLHAINNQGHGDAVHGARDKAAGVTAGICDMFLPVTCRQYAGLYIELKRVKGGTVSGEQRDFMEYAVAQGYKCVVARGYREAIVSILTYLQEAGYVQDPEKFAPIE